MKYIYYQNSYALRLFRATSRIENLVKKYRTRLTAYLNGQVVNCRSVISMSRAGSGYHPVWFVADGENEFEILADLYDVLTSYDESYTDEVRKTLKRIEPTEHDVPERIRSLPANCFIPCFSAIENDESKHRERVDRQCEKSAGKIDDCITECPKCREIIAPEEPYEKYVIIVGAALLPDEKIYKIAFMRISNKTMFMDVVKTLFENRFLRPGNYEQDHISKWKMDCIQPEDYYVSRREFSEGDIVYLRRKLDVDEVNQAHLNYVKRKYSGFKRKRSYLLSVELKEDRFISAFRFNSNNRLIQINDLQDKEKRTVRIKAYGMMKKEDIISSVRKKGFDVGECSFWPEVMIPFEDGQIRTDAFVCELNGITPVLLPEVW